MREQLNLSEHEIGLIGLFGQARDVGLKLKCSVL